MKDGTYAIYQGKQYSSGRMKDGSLILRSMDIGDVDKGFRVCEPFFYKNREDEKIVCVKYVDRSDVDEYYQVWTHVGYAGFEFGVLTEKDDEIYIVSLGGDSANWKNLGMTCINKGEYAKWIRKDEAVIKTFRKNL